MKNLNAFFFLCIPIYLSAQSDNYCPCQETQNNYEVLFEWSLKLHEAQTPVNLPPTMQNPLPPVMQEPLIVPVTVSVATVADKPEIPDEPEVDESRLNIAPEKMRDGNTNSKAKIRKKTDHFKGRVKKRKKARKYKGKCPAF